MKAAFSLLAAAVLCVTAASARPQAPVRRISRAVLEDKVRGGWAGQMIGVSFGAPTEFRFLGRTIEGELPWGPERIRNAIDQDDLYVEMTFAEVMDRVGLKATTEQYGEAFRDSKYNLWHANAGARRLLNNGIKAPWSGHPKYNIHANDIDFQIEADFIGLMCPGLPRESNRYCERVGRVMNYGDGLYGGMFVCGMYAAAFFESDPRKLVEAGVACIPADSDYARLIRDVIKGYELYPNDWKRTWQIVQTGWDHDDPCPGGVLQPFNIDAKLNGAYIAIGMLYGGGDFARTLEITTRCGQDSDCNPASAVGVLGVVLGYERIPDQWKSGIPEIADRKFAFTDYSFKDIIRSTIARAETIVRSAGGSVEGSELLIPEQAPRAPKLEQWDMGIAQRLIAAGHPDWTWTGEWESVRGRVDATQFEGKQSNGGGREAKLTFEGSAVLVVGARNQEGGRAEVYLDGKRAGEINAYIVERTTDHGLWHAYGLKPGRHTLRIVTREQSDPRSRGKKLPIYGAFTFRKRA
jgi:hypothetical protein